MHYNYIFILSYLLISPFILQGQYKYVQWANNVIEFSSEFSQSHSYQYRANQVLGPPNVIFDHIASPCAWSAKEKDNPKGEWLIVGFQKPQRISQVIINESFNPGTITKITLYDTENNAYVFFERHLKPSKSKPKLFRVIKTLTSYRVTALKVELQTSWVKGWNHIDAIGISESQEPIILKVNKVKDLYPINIVRMDENINSIYNDMFPVISADGKMLYFDRNNHPENSYSVYPTNDDIWVSKLKNGHWQKSKRLKKPLNNQYPNFVCSISPDGQSLILGNNYGTKKEKLGGVAISTKKKNIWSTPKKLNIKNYNLKDHFAEFNMAANQNILIMAINSTNSYGGKDLYVSFKDTNNIWSEPMNLGKNINTAHNELTPYLSFDTYTLYFASFGHAGYGSSDIFMSHRLDNSWQNWSIPENLGNDINTLEWEASFVIDAKSEYAYFCSYKTQYNQGIDIFTVKLPSVLKPSSVSIVKGRLLNIKTKQPLKGKIMYSLLPEKSITGIAEASSDNGEYMVILPNNNLYKIKGTYKNFLPLSENINLSLAVDYEEIIKNLYLIPINKNNGDQIELDNILFEFNSNQILEKSIKTLRYLLKLMKQHSKLRIVIEGHTDFGGDSKVNFELSKQRVNRVKEYLIDEGIKESRIKTHPMGSKYPVTLKRDEISKQKNRRVEFKILK